MEKNDKGYKRREFINKGVRMTLGLTVVGTGALSLARSRDHREVLDQSRVGRLLVSLNMRADLEMAGVTDSMPVVPKLTDGALISI